MGASVFFDAPEEADTAGFLAYLYDDEVGTVLGYTQSRRYAAGEMAIQHGDRDRSLYIITSGSFEVLVPSPTGPRRARVFSSGDIFGDLAFFDGKPRSADVRALADSEALVMTPSAFDRFRLAEPRLAMCFVLDLGRVLSVRFRAYNHRLAELGQL